MQEDFELFKGKTMSGLFKDIYDNQRKKKEGINGIIDKLEPHMKTAGYSVAIGTVIKDLIDTSVKNDDALIKLAAIAQRIMSADAKNVGDDGYLSDSEKESLLRQFKEEMDVSTKQTDTKIEKLEVEVADIKNNKTNE